MNHDDRIKRLQSVINILGGKNAQLTIDVAERDVVIAEKNAEVKSLTERLERLSIKAAE